MNNPPKIIIGRTMLVDFPGLRLKNVRAKIDTGAYRGSLHCKDIKVLIRHGEKLLSFVPLADTQNSSRRAPATKRKFSKANVKSTSGHLQRRYVINTVIKLDNKPYRIELTLSDRKNMRVPVLIGRKFLRGKFVVDVAH